MGEYNFFSAYQEFTRESPYDFAKRSSIGCGGTAKLAFCPRSVDEAVALLSRLERDAIPFYVLGNMTNVLPPDGETNTVIVSMKGLDVLKIGEETFAEAGVKSGVFLKACGAAKKSGAEFLSGIPCTMGGALFMNAGVQGGYISDIVESVLVYCGGKTYTLQKEECGYDYKKSVFMENGAVILGCWLRLYDETEKRIEEKLQFYQERRAHLPKGKSMGCVFKNPQGESAGRLIEGAGLKGLRFYGAKISERHANFIINENGATSEQIKSLIHVVKNAVYKQYGIQLEEEIRYFT